jgi:hypothetical protein
MGDLSTSSLSGGCFRGKRGVGPGQRTQRGGCPDVAAADGEGESIQGLTVCLRGGCRVVYCTRLFGHTFVHAAIA